MRFLFFLFCKALKECGGDFLSLIFIISGLKKAMVKFMDSFQNICLVVVIVLFCTGCANNRFKYPGAFPDRAYLNMYNVDEVGEIRAVDEKMVSYRNRIYLTVDKALQVSLNGHQVELEKFAEDFRYIYLNPDDLRHLPENPGKAVIFYATVFPANFLNASRTMEQEKRLLEINQIQADMLKVVQQLREAYSQKEFGMPVFGVTDTQLAAIEKMFPLNLAIYSSVFPENDNEGITAKMPPWAEASGKPKERNVISVLVDKESKLFLRDKPFLVENLTDTIKAMISNRLQNLEYPEKSNKAIVSLRNDRGTDYKVYLKVYNEIKRAYDELREAEAQAMFGKPYDQLHKTELKAVTAKIPFTLSEAEPTAFGEE